MRLRNLLPIIQKALKADSSVDVAWVGGMHKEVERWLDKCLVQNHVQIDEFQLTSLATLLPTDDSQRPATFTVLVAQKLTEHRACFVR